MVITHHAPHVKSADTGYPIENQTGYVTDLGLEEIESDVVWVHGHVHQSKDYTVNNVRVICNPRGYVKYNEVNPEFNYTLKFDV